MAEIHRYKAAFASTDGTNVNIHYGRAQQFAVYQIDDEEGYDFIETRTVTPVCQNGSHVIQQMDDSTSRFADCKYVVASRIGSGACASLTAKGIIAMELPGIIEEAILNVWKYNRMQGLFDTK